MSLFYKAIVFWTNDTQTEHLMCCKRDDAFDICEHEVLQNRKIVEIELYNRNLQTDEWKYVCGF